MVAFPTCRFNSALAQAQSQTQKNFPDNNAIVLNYNSQYPLFSILGHFGQKKQVHIHHHQLFISTSPSMPWLSMPWCILSRNPSSCPSPRETHFITLSASCLLATDSSVKAGLQKIQCWFSWFFMPESRARLVGELSGRGDVLHVKSLTHLHVLS